MGKKPASAAAKKPSSQRVNSGTDPAADRFRAVLHHVNDLVYCVSIDPDAKTWRLEFLSDRIKDFSGCRPEEFIEGGPLGSGGPFGLKEPETHAFELMHPDDEAEIMRSTRLLSQGIRVTREYRVRNRQTREYRWVEDRSEPEMGADGRVVGIWGIVRDITEQPGARERPEGAGGNRRRL